MINALCDIRRPGVGHHTLLAILLVLFVLMGVACGSGDDELAATEGPEPSQDDSEWTAGEIALLRSLWLGSLQPLSSDPTNAYGDDPVAAALGHKIFFDTRFSGNGEVSCATCHQPELLFTDGLPQAEAIGTTHRGTPTIAGTAYGSWFFWDGRRDSQWSQAMVPMESDIEHGGTRTQFAHVVSEDREYRQLYEGIFGPLADFSDRSRFPDRAGPVEDPGAIAAWESMGPGDQIAVTEVYVNLAKAIAAYERQIMPGPSRFDDYVSAILDERGKNGESILTEEEVAGLRLFMGRGNCTQCHNGPLLSNQGFHSVGIPDIDEREPDVGRFTGVAEVVDSEFNCLGPYSDAKPNQCDELRFVKTDSLELLGAFKVPSLRNVADTAPYMHSGQFSTLAEVMIHYNSAPSGPTGHSDLLPLGFTAEELDQLQAFLRTLSGPLNAPSELLAPP
jgi:cytochrome c peroxidase